MPRIRCRYIDCVYLESGFCSTDQIDLDPEMGCLTYSQEEEEIELPKAAEWDEEEEEEVLDEEEWDEEDLEEDLDEDDFEDEDDEDEDW